LVRLRWRPFLLLPGPLTPRGSAHSSPSNRVEERPWPLSTVLNARPRCRTRLRPVRSAVARQPSLPLPLPRPRRARVPTAAPAGQRSMRLRLSARVAAASPCRQASSATPAPRKSLPLPSCASSAAQASSGLRERKAVGFQPRLLPYNPRARSPWRPLRSSCPSSGSTASSWATLTLAWPSSSRSAAAAAGGGGSTRFSSSRGTRKWLTARNSPEHGQGPLPRVLP